ncbi:ATP-binding protein [Dactylosporangium sp. NPDC005555]|uniref:ATP-binding protein n=1 Tax=Dactylosporangium sp. NPDC005555 TaxID=3154889 RepID=UPI0033A85A52
MVDDLGAGGSGRAGPVHGAGVATRLVWRPSDGGDVSVVGRARAWLRAALPTLVGRSTRRYLHDDTELLLCELVTNALVHGGGVTAVELRHVGQALRVSVRDGGAEAPIVRDVPPDADYGRGLALVEALASRWGVDRSHAEPGKCVWLELPVHPGDTGQRLT